MADPFFRIRTTDGLRDVLDLRSARLFHTHTTTAASGSITVAGFNIAEGFIYHRGGGGPTGTTPLGFNVQWNNATKVLSWNNHTAGQPLVLMCFARAGHEPAPSPLVFRIRNRAGEILMDISRPVMSRARSFSVGHTILNDGVYWFAEAGDLATSGTEVALIKPATGQWVSTRCPNPAWNGWGYASNQATLNGVILDDPGNLPAPSGPVRAYVRSWETKRIIWTHDSLMGAVVDGLFFDMPYPGGFDPGRTWTLPGNAFALSGGGGRGWFDTGRVEGLRGRLSAANQITFDYGYIHNPTAGPGSSGAVSYASDVFALTGRIAA